MQENYVERILKKGYDVAVETSRGSCCSRLSRRLNNASCSSVKTFSRCFVQNCGAYNKIAQLSPISSSAASSAHRPATMDRSRIGPHPGIPAVIVMPLPARHQSGGGRHLGGEIVLHGDDYDQAYDYALEIGRTAGWCSCALDDPDVIAGQGTIAMEILRQHHGDDIDAIRARRRRRLIGGIAAYEIAVPGTRSSVSSPKMRPECTSHCAQGSA
jgi:threonine dehydratase